MINLLRKCPICGCQNGNEILDLDFENQENNPLPEHYRVVECEKCGFCFSEMDASQEIFNDSYVNCNVYSEAEGLRNVTETLDLRFSYIVDLVNRVSKNKNISIIDIGCGGGELLFALKEAGFTNIVGLDPSDRSVEHLKMLGIHGQCGSIFNELFVEDRYDVVISTAVVEHVYDLNGYIDKLKALMKSDGYIILNAPAAEGFVESMLPIPNNFNQEHINFFSKASLDNLMKKHKFIRCNNDPYVISFGEKHIIGIYNLSESDEMHISKDDKSFDLIKRYLDCYKMNQRHQEEMIRSLLQSDTRIVIFGAGSYTKQLIKKFPLLSDRVLFYVDNNTNKWGIKIDNKAILSPEHLYNMDEGVVILICCMKNGDDIRKQIERMNIKNNTIVITD